MIDYISFFEKQLERVNYWLSGNDCFKCGDMCGTYFYVTVRSLICNSNGRVTSINYNFNG